MSRMFSAPPIVLFALIALLGSAASLVAQGSGAAGVTGTVVDPSGGAVIGAAVVVRNEGTGYVRALVTDATGHFSASSMPAGTYSIQATATGFATQRRDAVQLGVGATENVALKMSVAAMNESISVTADARRLDVTSAAKSNLIDRVAVESLPIRGRNFTEFAQLSPNVMQEANRGGIVVNGQRSINSNISVDGVDFNDSLQQPARRQRRGVLVPAVGGPGVPSRDERTRRRSRQNQRRLHQRRHQVGHQQSQGRSVLRQSQQRDDVEGCVRQREPQQLAAPVRRRGRLPDDAQPDVRVRVGREEHPENPVRGEVRHAPTSMRSIACPAA